MDDMDDARTNTFEAGDQTPQDQDETRSGSDGGEPPPPDRSDRDDLFEFLKDADSFDKAELQSIFQADDMTDRQFGLWLHQVRERLRRELSVEFIVLDGGRDRPGFYVRANDEQKLARGRQFSRTAKRKTIRAYDVMLTVEEENLHPDRRSTYRHARERVGQEAVRAKARTRVTVPDGCETPEVPRRPQ